MKHREYCNGKRGAADLFRLLAHAHCGKRYSQAQRPCSVPLGEIPASRKALHTKLQEPSFDRPKFKHLPSQHVPNVRAPVILSQIWVVKCPIVENMRNSYPIFNPNPCHCFMNLFQYWRKNIKRSWFISIFVNSCLYFYFFPLLLKMLHIFRSIVMVRALSRPDFQNNNCPDIIICVKTVYSHTCAVLYRSEISVWQTHTKLSSGNISNHSAQ